MMVATRNGAGEDWLSRTMCIVETVMVRHGFVDDKPEKQMPTSPATHGEARRWIKFLASILRNQKLGIQFASKVVPYKSPHPAHCTLRLSRIAR